jgi:ParB family chromosome partitioning protein
VVNSGLITYASILEKYKALDPETRASIAKTAKTEQRTINSKDITDAVARKKVNHDVQRDAASVLQAFAPTDEKYDPGHAAKTRTKADALQITDHGGAPVLPAGGRMEFAAPPAGRTELTMTLAQVTVLASMGGFGEDQEVLGQRLHFSLPAHIIRDAIKTLGEKAPKSDAELVTSLMTAINAQF